MKAVLFILVIFCVKDISICFDFEFNFGCSFRDHQRCRLDFGPCSKTCGNGTKTEHVLRKAGKCAPKCRLPITVSCNIKPCEESCQWSSWSSFGECSKTCGGGYQKRTRKTENIRGGTGCFGESEDRRDCATECCHDDCFWSSWTRFSDCSVLCGTGVMRRTRYLEPSKRCKSKVCLKSQNNETETKECKKRKCAKDSNAVNKLSLNYTGPIKYFSLFKNSTKKRKYFSVGKTTTMFNQFKGKNEVNSTSKLFKISTSTQYNRSEKSEKQTNSLIIYVIVAVLAVVILTCLSIKIGQKTLRKKSEKQCKFPPAGIYYSPQSVLKRESI